MATKYCDHGAYAGDAVFTGYISNTANNDNGVAGKILTVTAVTSGTLNVGARIYALGLTLCVTGFTSGTRGGAGVYTIENYTVSASVILRATPGIVAKYSAPLPVPLVFGAPQEGDGLGKSPSTASATCSVDLTGLSAAAGASISVLGATLTCVTSGAGSNQFNAGSGLALAINIAIAINRTNNTVTVTGLGDGWYTHKVQDAVYARVTGSTLELMTRAGSATYNDTVAIAASGISGFPAARVWSGGVSGCWGVFSNHCESFWPSAMGGCSYGVFGNTIGPLAGTIAAGDVVVVRAGKDVPFVVSTSRTLSPSAVIAPIPATNPVRYVIDDGTEWPDGVNPVFRVTQVNSVTSPMSFGSVAALSGYSLLATKYTDELFGFTMANAAYGARYVINVYLGGSVEWVGVTVDAGGQDLNIQAANDVSANNNNTVPRATLRQAKFQSSQTTPFMGASGTTGATCVAFSEVEFSNLGNISTLPNFFAFSVYSARQTWYFDSCRWTNFTGGGLTSANQSPSTPLQIFFKNPDFGNLSVFGPHRFTSVASVIASSKQYGTRDFFISNRLGLVQWTSNRAYPTCNARLLDGVTPWSIHMLPTTTAGEVTRYQYLETPRIAKINTLPTGVRTLTLEIAAHEDLLLTRSGISILVSYLDATGGRVLDSYSFGGEALTPSTASWTSEVGGKVSFVDQSLVQLHDKYSLSVTTPTAILSGSEIGIVVCLHTTAVSVSTGVFVDPEIKVA